MRHPVFRGDIGSPSEWKEEIMLRGIATVNCYVEDPAAAAAWYSQVLGIEPYFNRAGPDATGPMQFCSSGGGFI